MVKSCASWKPLTFRAFANVQWSIMSFPAIRSRADVLQTAGTYGTVLNMLSMQGQADRQESYTPCGNESGALDQCWPSYSQAIQL